MLKESNSQRVVWKKFSFLHIIYVKELQMLAGVSVVSW